MFHSPITRSLFRSSPIPPAALLRNPPPKPSRGLRSISSSVLHPAASRPPASILRHIPRSSSSFPRRFLSTSPPRFYNGRKQYQYFHRTNEPVLVRWVRNARPRHFVMIGLGISGVYIYNTETVEMTGRKRFNVISHERELQTGEESYREILSEVQGHILPENHPITRSVNSVLQRLIPQVSIEGADWKVHVIDDASTKNAFVLPGGKVFVYTGILPICKDQDGLAAVLGHEIAHVVARHPAERMSSSIISLGTVALLSLAFDMSGQLASFLMSMLYSLPNSRVQEAEADHMGLMIMAKACYNPGAAVELWARMEQAEKGAPPQFMSTHPSNYNRMESIRGQLYQAEALWEDYGCSLARSSMPGFQYAVNQFSKW